MAASAPERFFLQYAPHSDFERGIFVPFATLDEAMDQATWDIYGGTDEDFIVGIFREKYEAPKFGWTATDAPDTFVPAHHDEGNQRRGREKTLKQIKRELSKRSERIAMESAKAQADYILDIDRAIRQGRADFKNAVPGNAYTWNTGGTATGGAGALVAATAKTLVLLLSGAANQPAVTEVGISFDGVTSSNVPVLVELVSGTATSAGTPRAALAAGKQLRGWPAQSSQTTCGDTYTAEPTVQLANRKWLVTPNGGLFVIQFPLGREPTGIVTATTDAKTWSLRCTAPVAVNAHAYAEFEE